MHQDRLTAAEPSVTGEANQQLLQRAEAMQQASFADAVFAIDPATLRHVVAVAEHAVRREFVERGLLYAEFPVDAGFPSHPRRWAVRSTNGEYGVAASMQFGPVHEYLTPESALQFAAGLIAAVEVSRRALQERMQQQAAQS